MVRPAVRVCNLVVVGTTGTSIGIDAVNLRSGGAVRHLAELLVHVEGIDHGFDRVVVWTNAGLASHLTPTKHLTVMVPKSSGNLVSRELWRLLVLPSEARRANCAVIFSPGGNPVFRFKPWVTMSQNLLPFDDVRPCEPNRKTRKIRVAALRLIQSQSFSRATGVIFLSYHARSTILKRIGSDCKLSTVIPFGISPGFGDKPALARDEGVFRWVYLSAIDYYKCQIEAVQAGVLLLDRGANISIDFIGDGPTEEKQRLRSFIPPQYSDHFRIFSVSSSDVANTLTKYDAALFLSMCESHPNALIECVASALPVVANDHGSIREVVKGESVCVNALDPVAIACGMETVIREHDIRTIHAQQTALELRQRTWQVCAHETMMFLDQCVNDSNEADSTGPAKPRPVCGSPDGRIVGKFWLLATALGDLVRILRRRALGRFRGSACIAGLPEFEVVKH
jgi:glycosyltransferase involved in cell wall biosynthesis